MYRVLCRTLVLAFLVVYLASAFPINGRGSAYSAETTYSTATAKYTGLNNNIFTPSISSIPKLSFNYPKVTVNKSLSLNEISKYEWTTVTISISGDTRLQTQKVPVSLVLALDYSGSMADDNAYKEVSSAAKLIVSKLSPGTDQVAIITVKSSATVEVPLTSDFTGIENKIDGFSPGGLSNIQEAFVKANALLLSATTPAKMVIFMSDGIPESPDVYGLDWAQMNYIQSHWQTPASHGISWYTIGYGPLPNDMLLDFLATKTGGTYQKAPTKQQLATAFQQAFDEGSETLSTRNVRITEVVSGDLRIRPDSLVKSITPVIDDPVKFDAEFASAEQAFYQTHVLSIPKISFLGAGQMFSFQFDVTSDTCSETSTAIQLGVDDLTQASADAPAASSVIYDSGQPTPSVEPIPQRQLTIKSCSVYVIKDLDEQTLEVTLTVRNTYDRAVRNVTIRERLSDYFSVSRPLQPPPRSWEQNNLLWEFSEIQSGAEVTLLFQVENTPAQQLAAPPYEIDHEEADVTYSVDDFQFEILRSDPVFAAFENDLRNLGVSNATAQFFAKYPPDIPEGFEETFRLKVGSPISTNAPTSEFGWMIRGEWELFDPEPSPPTTVTTDVDFYIKKTLAGYSVYRTVEKSMLLPQAWTSPNYNQP